MDETNISFYLRTNRVHIFVDALRAIGSPKRICFMIAENGKTLLIAPYKKRDLKSHNVPNEVYQGAGMEISSLKLCRMIASIYSWDISKSYRVPGKRHSEENVVIFDLTRAAVIDKAEE